MKTIVVDDEAIQLEAFRYESENLAEIEIIGCFDSPLEALAFAQKNPVELAFLDIQMPEMDGLALADRLRELYPQMKLIALTASDKHGSMAGNVMDGVVLKPYGQRELEKALLPLVKKDPKNTRRMR